MQPIQSMAIFSPDDLDLMRDRVFELLQRHGVKIEHPQMADLLELGGARVDKDGRTVHFPPELLDEVLSQSPPGFTLYGRDTELDLPIPHPRGDFYLRTGTGAINYLDPLSGAYRPLVMEDVAAWARLADSLEQIDFCPFPSPTDAPAASADVMALHTMLQNTRKHVWIQPYSEHSVPYLVELAAAAAGGEAALARQPVVSMIATVLSPLEFKPMDVEVILQAARSGIPIHACSLPTAGGTAPMTLPGVIVLAAAEILAMVAMARVVRPESPVIATPLIFTMDMSTGQSMQSSVEAMQGAAAAVQFIKNALGLPVHTYGCGSDAAFPGCQSASERSLLGLTVATAGADILGGAGQLETATALSPIQLIVDNEVAAMIRRIRSGLSVDNDTLAWEDLVQVPFGGQFLTSDHTLHHCQAAMRPKAFLRRDRETATPPAGDELLQHAHELWQAHLAADNPTPVRPDAKTELEAIVASAKRNLTD